MTDDERFAAHLQNDKQPFRVLAGETKKIGWIRLSGESEVQYTLIKLEAAKPSEPAPAAR